MDWLRWLEGYEVSPDLKARLGLVRAQLRRCLDALPPGPVRVLSLCAGDGRDLIEVLCSHPRWADVSARLIDSNAELVERGQALARKVGLEGQLRFMAGDATASSSFVEFVPVDILLLAGVFGNLRQEAAADLVGSCRCLCRREGFVVWTRHRRLNDGPAHIVLIRRWLDESGFVEVGLEDTSEGGYTVGTHRYRGEAQPLDPAARLFEFTGYDSV